MSELAAQQCVPCKGGVPPLSDSEMAPLKSQLNPEWRILERQSSKHGTIKLLARDFKTEDFASALRLATRIGALAEEQQHHPDLHIAWGKLGMEIWTHKIGGLTESDFIFAAKCDQILRA